MVRSLACLVVAGALLAPTASQAASTSQRLAALEARVAKMARSIAGLRETNKTLSARVRSLERQATYAGAAALDRTLPLAPSGLPNDYAAEIAPPRAGVPYDGHLWLTVTVAYTDMSGGIVHFAAEPGGGGATGNRCDGFSPQVWGSGSQTFRTYCRLDVPPGGRIRVAAGSYDQNAGRATAATAVVTGTLLEIRLP